MISEGFRLMFVGIGVVFVFLIIMILLINLMSYILSFFPEEEQIVSNIGIVDNTAEVALAVAAAKHRQKK